MAQLWFQLCNIQYNLAQHASIWRDRLLANSDRAFACIPSVNKVCSSNYCDHNDERPKKIYHKCSYYYQCRYNEPVQCTHRTRHDYPCTTLLLSIGKLCSKVQASRLVLYFATVWRLESNQLHCLNANFIISMVQLLL
jgi:hypothetical protein